MGTPRRCFFNRTTTRFLDYFVKQRRNDGGIGDKAHAFQMHVPKQAPAVGIHEIDFRQVHYGRAARRCRCRRKPALAQFAGPRTAQPSFQFEAEFRGTVVERNFEHPR